VIQHPPMSWQWGNVAHAGELVYVDGRELDGARVAIGLSCRLCDRPNCRSPAFPPLQHRLALHPMTASASPYRSDRA
jgi:hypothetical protein